MPNNTSPRRVAVLGSSGSIGKNTLEVIADSHGRLEPVLLSVHTRTDILVEQINQMILRGVADKMHGKQPALPRWVVVTDKTADRGVLKELPKEIDVFFGHDALCELVKRPEIDVVLSAIVGSAGLTSTWSALCAGKTVALANKESLVMGGSLITDLAQKNGGFLIPVDSEHSAVLQALQSWAIGNDAGCYRPGSVRKIILTASGGPFRNKTLDELKDVTVGDTLNHPVWSMGKKITVDSATLMNKALEIVEARWFFDIPAEKIEVIIHPQSVVHSMVEFADGSVIAQMSPPDMRLPIQLALNYPYRLPGPAMKLNWKEKLSLDFYPPDLRRFEAITLGLEIAKKGGTTGAVVNAANETAVNAFLNGHLPFHKIIGVSRTILEHHHFEPNPTLDKLLELDKWARDEAGKLIPN